MRNIFKRLLIILLLVFPIYVNALGDISVSPSAISIEVGSSATFTISAFNTVGDVSIASSNTSVASVSASYWETGMVDEGQTKTGTITVYGNSEGTTSIVLNIDAATFDDEDLTGQTRTVTVNVIAKSNPTPEPQNDDNNTNNSNSNSNTNGNNNSNNANSNLSTNNKLKELSVSGYEITKVDDNNYTLILANSVSKINVKATLEDSKAKVSGDGEHELNIGDNNIEIIVTSESGSQNKILLKVTRKDAYYLEDLDEALEDKSSNVDIIINENDSLSEEQLKKIKDSSKSISFNLYDESKILKYSWILDSSKIVGNNKLLFKIDNNSTDELLEASNYSNGIFLNINSNNNLLKGNKIKYNVSEEYNDKDSLNLYYYDSNLDKFILLEKNIIVNNGCVEFNIDNYDNYFLSKSLISYEDNSNRFNIFIIISILEFIIIIGLILYYFIKVLPKIKNNYINRDDNPIIIKKNN